MDLIRVLSLAPCCEDFTSKDFSELFSWLEIHNLQNLIIKKEQRIMAGKN
jgi:hypothetical protein